MPTTREPAAKAPSLTLAPVSPAAAQLLHQVYAEALAQAEASIPRPPEGSIVLKPRDGLAAGSRYRESGQRRLEVHGEGYQWEIELSTDFARPAWCNEPHWAEREWMYQPGSWSGRERRTDSNGRRWERSVGPFVDDGFGTLVEVSE